MNSLIVHFTDLLAILPSPPGGSPAGLATDGINFFSTWIARIGGLVAFIGAIKFALSIKNDDAKEQMLAILVIVSGFMIRAAVNDLSIFNIPASYSATAANNEFTSIMRFIGTWTRRVGAAGMLIGSVMFGLAIRHSDAGQKVTGLKTMASGGMVVAVSLILPNFV